MTTHSSLSCLKHTQCPAYISCLFYFSSRRRPSVSLCSWLQVAVWMENECCLEIVFVSTTVFYQHHLPCVSSHIPGRTLLGHGQLVSMREILSNYSGVLIFPQLILNLKNKRPISPRTWFLTGDTPCLLWRWFRVYKFISVAQNM